MKILLPAAAVVVLGLTTISNVSAQGLSKTEVKSQAVELCQDAAKKRYGENSVLSIGKKAKWDNSLKGASVRLKIKPESKRATKYSCTVYVDKSVTFSKA